MRPRSRATSPTVQEELPVLEAIRDAGALTAEFEHIGHDHNTVRLRAAVGYVTRTTTTKDGRTRSARPEVTAFEKHPLTSSLPFGNTRSPEPEPAGGLPSDGAK